MDRITQKDLEQIVERLNSLSDNYYILGGAYGGWRLEQVTPEKPHRQIRVVTSGYVPKKELYRAIQNMLIGRNI